MDAESGYEIKRARDAIQMIETIQSMIDVSADRLEGLRTQCLTSAELTQQEIRTLEGKLVKHFSRQLVIKAKFGEELQRELRDVPSLRQWLRVVGLSVDAIEAVCSRISSLEALRERSEHELRAILCGARDEEVRRLGRAMQRLRSYTEALARGHEAVELPLYWDSWERHGRGSPRTREDRNHKRAPRVQGNGGKSPTTPVGKRRQNSHLPAPDSLTKSRSHESQLSVRPDASDHSDNSQSSAVGNAEASPPASPHEHEHPQRIYDTHHGSPAMSVGGPRSPRVSTVTPMTAVTVTGSTGAPMGAVGGCMAHDIAHRFTKTFNMIATCDFCDKQMLFGSGLKCKECKFKCHRDCESKVPPSCGLPQEFVNAFKEKFHKDGGYYLSSPGRIIPPLTPKRRQRPPAHHYSGNPDSSSNTSSCNSSTPSSPALAPPAPAHHQHHHQHQHQQHHQHQHQHQADRRRFHFPDVKPTVSSPNHTSAVQSPARTTADSKHDLTCSVRSEGSGQVSLSGSGSTDSGGAARDNSVELAAHDERWPRQNSLSMKEWDIPYDELKLYEVIGAGRFGTVYRGSWHGAVAVKLLHVHALSDHCAPLDTFKHEVATFRKTRHENLVLFMGACMKPPRLAIVTSLCKGMTLYTHIHLRKDKFTANKSVLVAQQISQGMGYLHARGIVHKDLKTKNIFLENGKVVITDFGLFSVTKLCFGNNARGDSLGIPSGWLCYLAPELVRALRPHASLHLPFSKHTDVYAFGTVWYELLCGEYPFKGQPAEAVIWQVGKGAKQSLANMQASRDIKDILMLCWSYRASERPDFPHLLSTLEKLPRKRLARSPSHPVHLSRSADSVF
ncbi:kinase suppressor of Ras 2 isoform X2 [Zerene cesonia]|uniref:kinase suppressor of Ras 2 isoform X2 n=1 Tax=Zerene cesonia TaxID=33412 RepID=UPI0018E5088B|nr:kinase suppressor of Ras 2 isoform X2 [Zerene cesonia]